MNYLVTPKALDHLPLATRPCLPEQCNYCSKNFSRASCPSKIPGQVDGIWHLVRNEVHKRFFLNSCLHWIITKYFSYKNHSGIFFERHFFVIFWGLKNFCCLKTCFYLHQVKVICYHHYLLLFINKEHYWTILVNFCVKNLEMIQCMFFLIRDQNYTTLNQKMF